MPKISVLMAVHNGMPYLTDAMESIFSQTFRDFEFIVVDDASSDESAQVVRSVRNRSLRVIRNKRQLGLSRSLNKGLAIARGRYVARMDADDISLPRRLADQYSFLETHLNVDVLGTWTETLGLNSEQVWRYPIDDAEIRAEMLFNSVLVHSSVMLRRSTFIRHGLRYNPNVARAQDYELWARAADRLHFANLGVVLQRYRIHGRQVGKQQFATQQAVADEVRALEIRAIGLKPNQANSRLHNSISQWDFPVSRAGLLNVEQWLLTLSSANKASRTYSIEALASVLERRWWAACRGALNLGRVAWSLYTGSPLALGGKRTYKDRAVFWAKALIQESTQ
jgi:glycosyltransferase involved in cell wall biosynthesis